MANPASPRETNDTTGTKLGYHLTDDGGMSATLAHGVNPTTVGAATTKASALAVAAKTLHDGVDSALEGPVKIGGYAKATAPTAVSADGDRVAAWFLLNGAQATVLTAAGALIGGDATNGLDVDVTRLSVEVVDDAAFTPGTTKVAMVGFEADETATDSVDEGDGGAGRMTLDRKIIVAPYPHTAGGLQTANFTSSDGGTALTNTAQAIKASAGQVYGWAMHNPNDETCYVNFYNTASGSVTVGTTNPLFQFPIPAGQSANLLGAQGIEFTNAGFSASATKTAGSNTAPDTALEVAVFYK